jgi:hypothetical protein
MAKAKPLKHDLPTELEPEGTQYQMKSGDALLTAVTLNNNRALEVLRRLLPRLRKRAVAGWMANRCIACDYPHYPGRVCDCPHHEAEELLNDDPV